MDAPERPDRLARSWRQCPSSLLFSRRVSFLFPTTDYDEYGPPQKMLKTGDGPANERRTPAIRAKRLPDILSAVVCSERGSSPEIFSEGKAGKGQEKNRKPTWGQREETESRPKRMRKGGDGETRRQRQHEVLAREHDVHFAGSG